MQHGCLIEPKKLGGFMKIAMGSILTFLLVASCVDAEEMSMPSTIAPRITGASAAESNGSIFLHMITTRMAPVTRKQVVMRDGEKVEEAVTSYQPIFESKAVELAGEIKAFTRDGKELESKAVLERLKNPTPIAITEDGKLDPFYKALFRDDIVVVSLPIVANLPATAPVPVGGFPAEMPAGNFAPAAPQPIYAAPK
jgi:hypothetical protein